MWANRRNPPIVANENGAVLDRRRRDWIDAGGAKAQHAYGLMPAPKGAWTGQYCVGSVPG